MSVATVDEAIDTCTVLLVSLQWYMCEARYEFLIELSLKSKSTWFLLKLDLYVALSYIIALSDVSGSPKRGPIRSGYFLTLSKA